MLVPKPPPAAHCLPPNDAAGALDDGQQDWRSVSLSPGRVRMIKLLEAPLTVGLMLLMSLWVIFAEELKLALLPPEADLAMEITTAACLCAFLLELGEWAWCCGC